MQHAGFAPSVNIFKGNINFFHLPIIHHENNISYHEFTEVPYHSLHVLHPVFLIYTNVPSLYSLYDHSLKLLRQYAYLPKVPTSLATLSAHDDQ